MIAYHQKFVVDGTSYLFLLQKLKKGEGYDFLVSGFKEPSIITNENDLSETDQYLIKLNIDEKC